MKPYERQQGGWWEYPCGDLYGRDKIWRPVPDYVIKSGGGDLFHPGLDDAARVQLCKDITTKEDNMRLRAGEVRKDIVSAPGYEFVVEVDGKICEDLQVEIDKTHHLVIVKVLGERVDD